MIHKMEKTKYLEPKFALSLFPLFKFLVGKYKNSIISDPASIYSYSMKGGTNNNYSINDEVSISSLLSNETKKTF